MHGKQIKKYSQAGEILDDADFVKVRENLEKLMVQTMRDEGYLPIHDLRSQWSTTWLGKKYSFVLTMCAMYAGKKKAQEYDFIYDWRLVKIGRSVL
jgi:hypothetical protein